ncbi:hypothetical protein [Promicromonospora sp. NPDC050880]|uniref:hypothetical protein n=1 Tax=Promicromonospora sp. NPDC050880 TaxID=3364406 RepID=UPI00378DF2B1
MPEPRCATHGLLEPCLGCATVRNAARDGVTPQETYDAVVRGGELAGDDVRTCALDGCNATFTPTSDRHRYCKPAHRAAGHRARTGRAS